MIETATTDCETIISVDEALSLVVRHTPSPRTERVPLSLAAGRILAETIVADRDSPPFDRVMMDGYGVRLADAGTSVEIVGEAAPGTPWSGRLSDGQAISILTGAPCPASVQAVVPIECIHRDGNHVRLPDTIKSRQHIAQKGSDCSAFQTLIESDSPLTPLAIAVLASVGVASPQVFKLPSVGIIATGNELLGSSETPDWHHIRDSNSPMLAAVMHRLGLVPPDLYRVVDNPHAIARKIRDCDGCDIVILTGAVSAGRFDYIPEVVRSLGWRVVFHKVAQKPGKPLLFAERDGRLLFGLPGNPLAAHLGAQCYVAAAVRGMSCRRARPAEFVGRLLENRTNKGDREHFIPARITSVAAQWHVAPLPAHGSADVFTPYAANAFLRIAAGESVSAGELARFSWFVGCEPDVGALS